MRLWWVWCVPLCYSTISFSILYTVRIAGGVLPSKGGLDCPVSATSDCVGGAARRTAFLKNWKAQNNNTLVLDGGGAYFGRSYYNEFHVAPMAQYINAGGYDAVALQVADFHGTTMFLSEYLKLLKMPAVCSNIEVSADSYMNKSAPLIPNSTAPLVKPFTILQVAGVKVGLVSMVASRLASLSQPSPQIIINHGNPEGGSSDSIRAAVAMLRIEHPDCQIVLLTSDHYSDRSALDNMKQVIRSTYDIDVILATSAYPDEWLLPENNFNDIHQPVWVPPGLQSGGAGINCLNLTFDDDGVLINKTQEFFLLTNSTPDDPDVWADVVTKAAEIDLHEAQVAGYSNISLPYSYAMDGPMKRLIVDSMMDYCSTLTGTPCDFAILNAGGFAAVLPKGDITYGDIHQLFPFENQLSVFQLKGSFVDQAISWLLEYSFPVTAGLRFAWNPNLHGPERLVELEGYNAATGRWGPLNSNFYYKIVTISYLRGGGTGLTSFRDQAVNAIDNGPIDYDVFRKYVIDNSPLGGETPEFFQNCRNASLPLRLGAGDCWIVETRLDQASLNICPTNRAFCNSLSNPDMVSFLDMDLNISSCSACSGVGECVDLKCICSPLSDGQWMGVPMFRGSACNDLRSVDSADPGLVGFLLFLGSLTLAVSIALSFALFLTKKTRIIRASSPLFGHLIALGGVLGGAGVLLVAADKTGPTCNGRIIVCLFGYALIYSSLFAKTYRTHKIFNQTILQVKKIKTVDLLKIVGVVLVVEVVLLLAFFEGGINPLVPQYFVHGEWSSIIRCHGVTGQSSAIYFVFILVFNGGLLLWGVYLAFKTRNVPMQEFNESKLIASSLYNTTITGALAVILYYALTDSSPFLAEAIVAVAISYACLFTMLILYVPKFILIARKTPNASGTDSSMTTHNSGSKQLDPIARENAILRAALASLDQDVDALLLAAMRGSISVSGTSALGPSSGHARAPSNSGL